MGVPGLWPIVRGAAEQRSLSYLAHHAFVSNRNGRRAFILGIDAALWIFHAQIPDHGENPFLRTIFYKIATLLKEPVLPVFVFDGPRKPSQKRNNTVTGYFGTADQRSKQFKALLDVCGLEWWNAPGEAEAELAVMNRQGKIDGVLSDDGDALLFGAECLIRNNSPTLSGAQASSTQHNSSKADARHYEVYRSSAIRELWSQKDGTKLESGEDDRLAITLIALLAGGDYAPEGLSTFGPTIAFGLANAGFASCLKLYQTDRPAFLARLPQIHADMIQELRTNASSQIGRKNPDRAKKLAAQPPSALFSEYALDAYLNPATSPLNDPAIGWQGFVGDYGRGRGSLEGMARACELYFEWGTRELVVKKFVGEGVGMFGIQITNEARERIMLKDARDRTPASGSKVATTQPVATRITSFFGQTQPRTSTSKSQQATTPTTSSTPSHLLQIHSTRKDPTNPDITEYRISYDPERYITRCKNAMKGTRLDPRDLPIAERLALGLVERASPEDEEEAVQPTQSSTKSVRVWLAEYLVREAFPALVTEYEESLNAKLNRSPKKKQAVGKGVKASATQSGRTKGKGKGKEKEVVGDSSMFRAFFKPGSSTATPDGQLEMGSEPEEEVEEIAPSSRASSIFLLPDSDGPKRRFKPAQKPKPGIQNSSSIVDLSLLTSSRPSSPTPRSHLPGRRRTSVKPKKNSRPHPPTSSLSSSAVASRSSSPVYAQSISETASIPSSSSPPAFRRKSKGRHIVLSPPSTPGPAKDSQRSANAEAQVKPGGGKEDPIILSDDDTPVAIRTRARSSTIDGANILNESGKPNRPLGDIPQPLRRSLRNIPTSSKSPSPVKATSRGGTNTNNMKPNAPKALGFPVIQRRSQSVEKAVKVVKPVWTLVKSTDEVDYFDCTGRGWVGGFPQNAGDEEGEK